MTDPATVAGLKEAFPDLGFSEFRGQTRVVAPRAAIYRVLQKLKEDLGFDLLVDVTCVDYLYYREAKDRFGLVYLLANTRTNERITVRTFVNDGSDRSLALQSRAGMATSGHADTDRSALESQATVPSVVPLWEGANWLEREVWDLFGIRFEGHPDLRRVVLPEEFTAHPLRKDYPLQGLGERHNFPVITRAES